MTVGRPANYNSAQALETAMLLFWRNGYAGTSLDDLTRELRLSRSSFYNAFGSKRQLFLSCLEQYQDQTSAELGARLDRAPSGKAFIQDTLQWAIEDVVEGVDPQGCLVMNTAAEFAQRDPAIAERVAHGLTGYRQIFLAAVRRTQQEGDMEREANAEMVASYLVTTMSGLRTMAKAGADLGSLQSAVALAMKTM